MINNILFQYQSFSDRLEVKSLCITRVFIIYYLLNSIAKNLHRHSPVTVKKQISYNNEINVI